jgi:hypothetical protein
MGVSAGESLAKDGDVDGLASVQDEGSVCGEAVGWPTRLGGQAPAVCVAVVTVPPWEMCEEPLLARWSDGRKLTAVRYVRAGT